MKKNDILTILIPTCILIFIWIGFNIHHSAVTSTIPEATNIQIAPIVPRFDMQIIDNIKKRETISPILELGQSQATASAAVVTPVQPSPTTIPIATSTATQTSTPSAQ